MRRDGLERREGNIRGFDLDRVSGMSFEAYLSSLGSAVAAHLDPTSDAYFTFSSGAQISAYVDRIAGQVFSQGTAANQPLRDVATATMGGKNTVFCDGVSDFLGASANPNFFKFLHDGNPGASVFVAFRQDGTSPATSSLFRSASTAAQVGWHLQLTTGASLSNVYNGSGTAVNSWTNADAAHYARDLSRVQMWGYVDGTSYSRIPGSSLSNADTVAQDPSIANPSAALLMGSGSAAFKGWIGDVVFLRRIATADETSIIFAYLKTKYSLP